MKTFDNLVPGTWDMMEPDNPLWEHFPMERCKPSSLLPTKELFRTRCPECGGKLLKRKFGPIVESRHSIYFFKFWVCGNCDYVHGSYFLDLGG